MKKNQWLQNILHQRVLVILLILFVVSSIVNKEFLTAGNLRNLLLQVSVDGVIAVGMTFVIITGGIDLSVGSVVALTTVIIMRLQPGSGSVAGVVAALCFGLFLGSINGLLVTKVGVNPFVSTLGMLTFAHGLALRFSNNRTISGIDPGFAELTELPVLGIPFAALVFILLVLICHYVLTSTAWGRGFYAVGGNKESSWLSGFKVDSYIITAYVLAGFLAALGGVLLASRINTGSPIVGSDTPLIVITAVLLGGTRLTGGSGTPLGTMQGILVIGVLRNGLNLFGVGGYAQTIILGSILIFVMLLDRYSTKIRVQQRSLISKTG